MVWKVDSDMVGMVGISWIGFWLEGGLKTWYLREFECSGELIMGRAVDNFGRKV